MTKATETHHDKIIDAALGLAADVPWDEVRMSDVAKRADVSLTALRDAFDDKSDVLHAFSRRIDRQVLERIDPEMSDEPARDRLLDILVTRFEMLQPHRSALKSIAKAYGRDPIAMLDGNRSARVSMRWMLEAAGIDAAGRAGDLRAQGLVLVFLQAMRVFLEDDDPGMARTMAELDRGLRRGVRSMRRIENVMRAGMAFGRALRPRRRRRRRDDHLYEDDYDPDDLGPAPAYRGEGGL